MRSALERYTTRSVLQTSSQHSTPACSLWTPPWRWALAQHRTSFSQPGHIRQRAVVPRWPEEPLAQLSWASSPWHRRRSRTDICDQACGRPSLRRDSRPSRGSAALAFPTSGFSTERVRGQHAWSQMHGRLRRRCRAEEDRSPAFVPRAASAERYNSTCYRVTRCETGHSCCRAAHWRTACVSCVVRLHTAEWESLRSKARLDRACPSPN